MENNKKGISLATYVISLIIMLGIIGVLLFIIFKDKEGEVTKTVNAVASINTTESAETKENLLDTKERTVNNEVSVSEDTKKDEDELLSGNVSTTQVYKNQRKDNLGTPLYIIFDGNRMFIGEYEDMANEGTIILGTYKVDSNNVITIDKYITETQEYGFFSGATIKYENGKLFLYDGNEETYYEKVEY